MRAKTRTNGSFVAIKLIENIDSSSYTTRKVLREVKLLKKLSEIENNIFTTLLLDIIAPETKFDHIFLVMSLGTTDMKSFLESRDALSLNEDHILTLLYNMICSLHFVHSMGIIHRDIKPGNLLMDANCGVTICDFGLARTMPQKTDKEKELSSFRRKEYQKVLESPEEERTSRESAFRDKVSSKLNEARQISGSEKTKRSLTCCVMSRFYRSPEVITVQCGYNQSADIWSTGCILLEFLLTLQ